MKSTVALWFVILGTVCIAQAGPLDKLPRIKNIVEITTPENYEVTITLTDGKKIVTERVGLSPASLEKRFGFNALDKTVRVMPKGETKRVEIETADIDKIEFVKVKDKDKDEDKKPEPQTVPKPVHVRGCN